MIAWGWEQQEGRMGKGHEEMLRGDENACYLDYSDSFTVHTHGN